MRRTIGLRLRNLDKSPIDLIIRENPQVGVTVFQRKINAEKTFYELVLKTKEDISLAEIKNLVLK